MFHISLLHTSLHYNNNNLFEILVKLTIPRIRYLLEYIYIYIHPHKHIYIYIYHDLKYSILGYNEI